MRLRQIVRLLIYILTPVLILACSVVFVGNFHTWLRGQRHDPLLWLVDFCAVYTLLLLVSAVNSRDRADLREQEVAKLQEENDTQWQAINAQADEIERERVAMLNKVAEMEAKQGIEQMARVDETRYLTEQAFRAVQGQMEAQGRQLEAVNLALQHHRAEISQLRQAAKLIPAPDTVEAHFAEQEDPPEYAAVAAASTNSRTLTERRDSFTIQPAHDPDAAAAAPRSTIEL